MTAPVTPAGSLAFEDFKKVNLCTAKILDVQEIAGADRLWKLLIDVGAEKKEIVAGIKLHYPRETLLGKTILVVNNLQPSVIRGVESKGMLLAAKSGQQLCLVTVDSDLPAGCSVG